MQQDFSEPRTVTSTTDNILYNIGYWIVQLNKNGIVVQLPPEVEIANDSGNPVPVSFPGGVEISNDLGNPVPVSGTVAATQSGVWSVGVTGSVEISNDVGNPIPVNGTVAATQSGAWTVGITSAAETFTSSTINTLGAGSVTAGAKSLVIITSSDFSGTIATDSYAGSITVPIAASPGGTINAIAYNIVAGSLKVIRLQ